MNSKRLFRKIPGWKIEGLSDLLDDVTVLQLEVALAEDFVWSGRVPREPVLRAPLE
jgi:hypothetical protein